MIASDSRGFSLIEMAIVLVIFALLLAFSLPAYLSYSASHQLRGATENIAAQLRLGREKAIATGVDQPFHFTPNFMNSDYHVHYPNGQMPAKWRLPSGIFLHAVTVPYVANGHPTMLRDGRASGSGLIILRDRRGNRDTVSVLVSGLVLTK